MKKKRIIIAAIIALCAVILSGCLRITADELYRLPRASDEYLKLQQQIDYVLNSGAAFSPPTGGPNRQAVQLRDLNSSGEDEVIVFFSVPGESTLAIYIFKLLDGDYVVADVIEGVGDDIESIWFVDMDGDGIYELIVGWQMGAVLKQLSIYSIVDFQHVLLASAEYERIAAHDMTGDGSGDIVIVRLPTPEMGAVAEMFSLMPDGEIVRSEAWLSDGIEMITRILTGRLIDGIPAVFVESEGRFDDYGGSMVTDILIYRDGGLVNVTREMPLGISAETVRDRMHSSDIEGSGTISVPMPRRLVAQSETLYYVTDWYAFNSRGNRRVVLTTYHNHSDGWYLVLPSDWRGRVSVRRESAIAGERSVVFSYIAGEDGPFEDFLVIHRLSGDRGRTRAALPGRTILRRDGDSIYAFELLSEPNSFGLTFDAELIIENFRLIYTDWLIGW